MGFHLFALITFLLLFSCNSELAKLNRISNRLPFLAQLGSVTQGYPGANGSFDHCRRVVVDRFENIVCTGYSDGVFGAPHINLRDLIVAKFDRHGNLLWTYQAGAGRNDEGRDLVVDDEGNIFVIANVESDDTALFNATPGSFALIALTPNGELIGSKKFDSNPTSTLPAVLNPNDAVHSIVRDKSGNFYISGNTRGNFAGENAGAHDAFILKLDPKGVISARYQRGSNLDDSCFDITLSPDEKYIYCAGRTNGTMDPSNPHGGGIDAFILRLDAETLTNEVLTQYGKRTLAHSTCGISDSDTTEADFDDEIVEIKIKPPQRVFAVGRTSGNLGLRTKGANGVDSNGLILALDLDLNRLSCDLLETSGNDNIYDVAVSQDRKMIYAGVTNGTLFETTNGQNNLILQKQNGFSRQFGQSSATGANSVCVGITLDSDDNVYCVGRTTSDLAEPNGGGFDIFLLRLFPDGSGR